MTSSPTRDPVRFEAGTIIVRERWKTCQYQRDTGRPVSLTSHDTTMRISHETIYTYLYVLPRWASRRSCSPTWGSPDRTDDRSPGTPSDGVRSPQGSHTYDQGKEMSEHRLFIEETDVQVYFAHPHSPWERGTSENTNGLLRHSSFPRRPTSTRSRAPKSAASRI